MSLSKRHIDTLINLVDIEIKVLDAYPDEGGETPRIPLLETCRMELVTLAAADRARRKKAFPEMSWKKGRAANKAGGAGRAEMPQAPEAAPVDGGDGISLPKAN